VSAKAKRTPCEKCGGKTCCPDARCCHKCAVTIELTGTACGAVGCLGIPEFVWQAFAEEERRAESRGIRMAAKLLASTLPESIAIRGVVKALRKAADRHAVVRAEKARIA